MDAALEALCARLSGGGTVAAEGARSLGVTLGSGRGARSVTGEPAADDAVGSAVVATRVGATAVVLVVTACGNAQLVALRWDGDGAVWQSTDRAGLVTDARPGGCRTTEARAEGRGMANDEPREIVAVFGSESEEGDEVRTPVLRVYRLTPAARLERLSADLPFGGTDDATGAAQRAEWVVDEALTVPRDLYVQLSPGRPGPGGLATQQVVRRTYRLQGSSLRLVDETTEAVRPVVPGTGVPLQVR